MYTGRKRLLSGVLAVLLAMPGMFSAACLDARGDAGSQKQRESGKALISAFRDPDVHAKGMFRCWFANGDYRQEDLQNEIKDLYEKGFGGIEIATLPMYHVYDDHEYYWGQQGWVTMLKNILKSSRQLPGDFKVDVTLTPYWPVATDSVDPNDEGASTELVYACGKITDTQGSMDLPMPEVDLLCDGKDNVVPFIHTNRFEAATIAQVKEIGEDGAVVLDSDTMRDVSGAVREKKETTKAGIPDREDAYVQGLYEALFADENHGGYKDCVVDSWDKLNFDFWGDRLQMQDTQKYYTVDKTQLSLDNYTASAGDELKVGDYVLFGFYRKGTGETHNKSCDEMRPFGIYVVNTTPNGSVVTNCFNTAGAETVTDYWDTNILDDELIQLMKEKKGDVFEDSLEAVSSYPFWTETLLDESVDYLGYDLTAYLPVIAGTKGTHEKVFATEDGSDQALRNDYLSLLEQAYRENHVGTIQQWAKETMNYGFRLQGYGNEAIDSGLTAYQVDTAEGETLGFRTTYNKFRQLAAGVHMAGKTYISDECMAIMGKAYGLDWEDYITTINKDFAAGVNRIILHGYNFLTTTQSDDSKQWPGWYTMGTFFSDAFGPRQAYWENFDAVAGYVDRTQAILQGGAPAVDVAVYEEDTFTGTSEDIAALLNRGYSYDVLSTGLLTLDVLQVQDGILKAEDAAYQALIVYDMSQLAYDAAEKLLAYAKNGLPVIFYKKTPETVKATRVEGKGTQQDLEKVMEELLGLPNVWETADDAALLAALKDGNVEPAVQANIEGFRTVHREDVDGTDYYYLMNQSDKKVSSTVVLEGEGVPFLLNAWTGDSIPAASYKDGAGNVEIPVELNAYEAMLVAVTRDTVNFPKTEQYHITDTTADETVYTDGSAILVKQGGTYVTAASNGQKYTSAVDWDGETIPLKDWTLDLESWGPYAKGEMRDTNQARKESLTWNTAVLKPWNALEATKQQLEKLGVSSMKDVSGVGVYRTVFTLPEDWSAQDGLYLKLAHGNDMIEACIVNGQDAGLWNAMSNQMDIGKYLKPGENTLQIKVASTLINRVIYENRASGKNHTIMNTQQDYGLTLAELIPYRTVSLESMFNQKEALDEAKEAAREAEEARKAALEEYEKAKAESAKALRDAELAAKEYREAQAAKTESQKAAKLALDEAKKEADKILQEAKKREEEAKKAYQQAENAKREAKTALDKVKFTSAKITVKSVKSPKKGQVKISWKKKAGVKGYQIQYSHSSNFKKKTTVTVKKGTAKVIKKLKSNKKYYFRMRAYKTVGGKKIYTKYSNKKSVEVE